MTDKTLTDKTSSRKLDHVKLCAELDVSFGSAGFDCVRLVHNAAGGCDLEETDTGTELFGHHLSAPLFIEAMTGGHPETKEINRTLAAAAEAGGFALGVGSERAALENPAVADSFTVVREAAPNAFIAGNIGAAQLVQHGPEWACRAVELIDADALCIHVNTLQELLQPEGDRCAAGFLSTVSEAAAAVHVPVIVKETGAGISREAAKAYFDAGASAVDVGGFGGTSWAKVELLRKNLLRASDKPQQMSEELFLDWGIPTAVSVFEVAQVKCGPVIASGGLRSGMDAAKSIALGADVCGMAKELLSPALEGKDALMNRLSAIVNELKAVMFLTGAKTIPDLQKVRYYLTGVVREMTQEIK
ncbi:MAG TPA: type 2 isopentenyl-diphosphate Delta-isomerase [Methanocorpusculum sp.]|nr:type 2 isopentenyl-diphosphate Delta-isomerase [Methanocorpusculum sp.]